MYNHADVEDLVGSGRVRGTDRFFYQAANLVMFVVKSMGNNRPRFHPVRDDRFLVADEEAIFGWAYASRGRITPPLRLGSDVRGHEWPMTTILETSEPSYSRIYHTTHTKQKGASLKQKREMNM